MFRSPSCAPEGIRVRTAFSLISVGTESASLGGGVRESLLLKAIRNPELLRKVFDPVSSQGLLLYTRLASVKNPQQ